MVLISVLKDTVRPLSKLTVLRAGETAVTRVPSAISPSSSGRKPFISAWKPPRSG